MPCRLAFFLFIAISSLTACEKSEESAAVVHDVRYFLDHPDERKATLEKCHNNPGQLKDDANCKNASAAERDAFIDEAQKSLQTD